MYEADPKNVDLTQLSDQERSVYFEIKSRFPVGTNFTLQELFPAVHSKSTEPNKLTFNTLLGRGFVRNCPLENFRQKPEGRGRIATFEIVDL